MLMPAIAESVRMEASDSTRSRKRLRSLEAYQMGHCSSRFRFRGRKP